MSKGLFSVSSAVLTHVENRLQCKTEAYGHNIKAPFNCDTNHFVPKHESASRIIIPSKRNQQFLGVEFCLHIPARVDGEYWSNLFVVPFFSASYWFRQERYFNIQGEFLMQKMQFAFKSSGFCRWIDNCFILLKCLQLPRIVVDYIIANTVLIDERFKDFALQIHSLPRIRWQFKELFSSYSWQITLRCPDCVPLVSVSSDHVASLNCRFDVIRPCSYFSGFSLAYYKYPLDQTSHKQIEERTSTKFQIVQVYTHLNTFGIFSEDSATSLLRFYCHLTMPVTAVIVCCANKVDVFKIGVVIGDSLFEASGKFCFVRKDHYGYWFCLPLLWKKSDVTGNSTVLYSPKQVFELSIGDFCTNRIASNSLPLHTTRIRYVQISARDTFAGRVWVQGWDSFCTENQQTIREYAFA